MAWLAVVLGAGVLLAIGGAMKVLDPVGAVGAIRAAGWDVPPVAVRVLALVELAVGAALVVTEHSAVRLAAAASYLAFAAFVASALASERPISSCGCFGRPDTPPTAAHVVLNLALAAGLVASAVGATPAPSAALADDPLGGVLVVGVAGLLVWMAWVAYAVLPALVHETRRMTHDRPAA